MVRGFAVDNPDIAWRARRALARKASLTSGAVLAWRDADGCQERLPAWFVRLSPPCPATRFAWASVMSDTYLMTARARPRGRQKASLLGGASSGGAVALLSASQGEVHRSACMCHVSSVNQAISKAVALREAASEKQKCDTAALWRAHEGRPSCLNGCQESRCL